MSRALLVALSAAAAAADTTPVVGEVELVDLDRAVEPAEGTCAGAGCTDDTPPAHVFDLLSFRFDERASDARRIGRWEGDSLTGHGMERSSVGSYQGDFANGQKEGMGEFTWTSDVGPAASYKGMFKGGQLDGLGAMTFDNGDRFFGVWSKGQKLGEGFYLEKAEMDVQMEAEDGKVELKQAICEYDDGTTYTGQLWAPLKMSAGLSAQRKSAEVRDPVDTVDGVCHWVPGCNGDMYEFVKPHGRGVIEYANGDRYAGEWSRGRPHGDGMLVRSDGTAEYGHWENGNRV